jgi:hypothetical protein
MKYILLITAILIAGTCITGFVLKSDDPSTGHLLIGLSVAGLFFLWMPVFIYYRWKDRSMKDYMLTKENIDKMREYSKDKKL